MDINWNEELLSQLEWHWEHQLRPRLDGLTDDEYFWQPAPGSWNISSRGASTAPISVGAGDFTMDYALPPPAPEPVTTIAWRLAHIIVGVFGSEPSHSGGPRSATRPSRMPGTAADALRSWTSRTTCGSRPCGDSARMAWRALRPGRGTVR